MISQFKESTTEAIKFKSKEDIAIEFKKQTGNHIEAAGTILAGIEIRNNFRAHGNLKQDTEIELCPYTNEQLKLIDLYNGFKKKSPYLFHVTKNENIENIVKNGLLTWMKVRHEGVSGAGKISLAANEQIAKYYGGESDILLRVKKGYVFDDLEPDFLAGEGAYTTRKDIPSNALEIKITNKWLPLERYKSSDISTCLPFTAIKPSQTHLTIDNKKRQIHNSNGNLIHETEEGLRDFWGWFGDSIAVDSEGRPLIVYRGEHGIGTDLSTRLGSWSFGSKEIAEQYAQIPNNIKTDSVAINPKVFSAYLKITNPLINTIDDPFIDLSVVWDKFGKDVAIRVARENFESIREMDGWQEDFMDEYGDDSLDELINKAPGRIKDLYIYTFKLFDDAWFVNLAKEAWFDGAIHAEYGFHTQAGEHAEFKVFDRDQIRITSNQNNVIAIQCVDTDYTKNRREVIETDNEESTNGPSL